MTFETTLLSELTVQEATTLGAIISGWTLVLYLALNQLKLFFKMFMRSLFAGSIKQAYDFALNTVSVLVASLIVSLAIQNFHSTTSANIFLAAISCVWVDMIISMKSSQTNKSVIEGDSNDI